MRMTVVLLGLALFIITGCGEQEPGSDQTGGNVSVVPADTIIITAADTLGAESGEGCDVFAFVVEAAYTPQGNIAVLDAGKICLKEFSPSGEELLSIGRQGSGPGEYQMPIGMAVLDGGYVISDIAGAKIIRYDSAGTFLDELTGFFPIPPARIKGYTGMDFLAADIIMDLEGDEGPTASVDLVAYADSSTPSMTFRSYPMDMIGGRINSDNGASLAFAAGPSAEAYLVVLSDSMFVLAGFSADGSEILSIAREYDRIPLTEEELEDEELDISLTIHNGETSLGTDRHRTTATHRNIIEGLGVDQDGNIWVEMGDELETYFRVYSPEGVLLHIAVPDESIQEGASFSISPEGMLAYDGDPEDWPKIYLLEVR